MKTLTILPAMVFGAASMLLGTTAFSMSSTHQTSMQNKQMHKSMCKHHCRDHMKQRSMQSSDSNWMEGTWNATTNTISDLGNGTVAVGGWLVNGTAQLLQTAATGTVNTVSGVTNSTSRMITGKSMTHKKHHHRMMHKTKKQMQKQ